MIAAKLAGILLSAKASAVSGALILAGGAVVSASTGAGVTGLQRNDPEPTPIVNVVEPEESPLDEFVFEPVGDEPATEEILPVTEADCEDEQTARADARSRIDAAFKKYDKALDKLAADLDGKGSPAVYEALANADALLTEIHTQAISALDEMGLCEADLAARVEGAVALRLSGGALALLEVSERTIAAMETVYNLARSTVLQELQRLKPTPTPKAKKTEAPKKSEKARATEKPKHSKEPRCDDAMYAAKKRLQRSFDEYHGGHDKLIKALKGWSDDRSMSAFRAADEVLHETYDRTRERIVHAGCATGENSAMGLAERAEVVFRETYNTSKELFQIVAANKPQHDCTDAMYAAKEVMYEAFERWHGANDKLISGIKSFASKAAIDAARDADEKMHGTFDRTKEAIIGAGCTKDQATHVMRLAKEAARVFEVEHQKARAAVAAELAKKD